MRQTQTGCTRGISLDKNKKENVNKTSISSKIT